MITKRGWFRRARGAAVATALAVVLGFGASNASAKEPIVGLWRIAVKDSGGNVVDNVLSTWTSDGVESDQDIAPILTGYVCYGTWIKLGGHTYGLTHPFFGFQDVNSNGEGTETTEGQWDGTSGYFNYTVSVANDGKTFTGKENLKFGVPGPNPYAPGGTLLTGFTLSATKIEVNKSQLP
jgi:hypothetical protein